MNAKVGLLADAPVNVRVKLASLWASVLFCYLYGDFFGLYKTGQLERIMKGSGPFGLVTQESMLAVAAVMAVPCVMVCLSVLLRPALNRWVNIVVAVIFIAFAAATLRGEWYFYTFLILLEIALKAAIVWQAWTWPREPARA